MVLAIVLGGFLSATLLLFASAGIWRIYKPEGAPPSIPGVILATCVAAFCSLGTAKFVWDWFHPKAWSLYLTTDAIGWQTPHDSALVQLAEIQEVTIQDIYDSPRMAIALRRGGTLDVHPNCLGNLESLWQKLHNASSEIALRYDGHGPARIRKKLAAEEPPGKAGG